LLSIILQIYSFRPELLLPRLIAGAPVVDHSKDLAASVANALLPTLPTLIAESSDGCDTELEDD
jgi:hypothetical protein